MTDCFNTEDNCPGKMTDFVTDNAAGDIICSLCGAVQEQRLIQDSPDWNSYSSENGGIKNNSRCGWTDPTNPYDSVSTIIPKGCKRMVVLPDGTTRIYDLAKWQQRILYNSKERSFSIVAKEFGRLMNRGHIPKKIIVLCKHLWTTITKTGRINRGGNRTGMIACCVLYAFAESGVPRCRQEVAKLMDCDETEITKGEPLFRDALEGSRHQHILQNSITANSMFARFIGRLRLPYKISVQCQKIEQETLEELSFVAPKSAVAAIICYVIKIRYKLKKPTKKEISKVTGVCNPTMNKTLKYIVKYYDQKV